MSIDELEIRPAGNAGEIAAWDEFVRREPTLGPFYAYSRVEHVAARAADAGGRNLSFLLYLHGRCVGVAPLVLHRTAIGSFFWSGGGFNTDYAPAVSSALGPREQRWLLNGAFAEVDRLALANDVLAAYMTIDPYQSLTGEACNWLCRYGYLDASIATNVVDLQCDLELLRARRRKSYKSLINKGLREFGFQVMDAANHDRALFDAYVAMHEKAAGRKTRSSATFERQDAAIRNGEAVLIVATFRDAPVHLVYFNALNGYAYYSSSAEDPDFGLPHLPTAPALLWYAIEHFRAAGYRYLETGWQPWGPQFFEPPGEKQIDIAFFKEGFGGRNVALFRGVKYFDQAFMRRDLQERLTDLLVQNSDAAQVRPSAAAIRNGT